MGIVLWPIKNSVQQQNILATLHDNLINIETSKLLSPKDLICLYFEKSEQGVQKLTRESLKVVWAKFSTLS
jgi:hypothetical protein